MNLPTLSVVIPNYNHGHLLPRCLDSILTQSVQATEIMIIDDGSTDNSVEIVEQWIKKHPSIRLLRNERNMGVVYTVNRALDLAAGDFVHFPAADDVVMPGLFEKSLNILAHHPRAALCCTIGDWREVGTGLNWHVGVGMADRPCYLSPTQIADLERKGRLFIASNTTISRREALIQGGKYNPELKWHCDWFLLYLAAFRHGICFVPEPLAVFNIYPDSYYKRGVRDQHAHRKVLRLMLDLLNRPDNRDVEPLIRESGALFQFGWPILQLVMSEPGYRKYLNPRFLRKNLWHITKLQLKKVTPAFAGNLYFRFAGYRARAPSPAL